MARQICGYCNAKLGPAQDLSSTDQRISHGICRNCLEQILAGSGETLDEFLDSLPQPIFIVSEDFRIVTANAPARETVGKDMAQITGHLGGEVFGCSYENIPGGCGESIHCQSCAIRGLVRRTFETGEPSVRVPACQDLDTVAGPRRIRFLISTEHVGNAVLLRIDDAQPEDPTDSK